MLTGLAAAFFYLFSFVLIASSIMVVLARNPVHSVLFLILVFFNASALFLLAGAEFLAMILLLVYVGAVAVLFLFVVMMLDVDFARMRQGIKQYASKSALVGIIIVLELIFVFISTRFSYPLIAKSVQPMPDWAERTNTQALGDILYTEYVFYFQLSGLILLVAMIGAIVLTLRHKKNVRRQSVSRQLMRDAGSAIEIKKVKSRKQTIQHDPSQGSK